MTAVKGPNVFTSVTVHDPTPVLLTTPIIFGQSTTLWDNTAVLSGLSVTDAQGNLREFDVTSASTSGYLVDLPEAIPEPSTILLAAFGFAVIVFRRRC